jgi:hypothetical protein
VSAKDQQASENDQSYAIGEIGHDNQRFGQLGIVILPGISMDNMHMGKGGETPLEFVNIPEIDFDRIQGACLWREDIGKGTTAWTNFQEHFVGKKPDAPYDLFDNGCIP